MNRTIRNLIVAAPLATIALTLVPMGAATAGPNGPVVIAIPKGDPHPGPKDIAIPEPKPKPQGPQDKAAKPQPKGPQDKAPKPAAKPAPKPQAPQAQGSQVATKADTTEAAPVVAEVVVDSAKGSPDSIDRNDNLFASVPVELVAEESDGGIDMAWLLAGGALVTVTGVAFAARKRHHNA